MDYYRAYHGMPYDPQLAVVARRAGIRRSEALALMVALMDHASQNNPRGSLEGLDAEKLSVAIEMDMPVVEAALKALRDKGLIRPDNTLSGWEGRQTTSTDRVRSHRKRRRMHHETDDTAAAIAARHARLRRRKD